MRPEQEHKDFLRKIANKVNELVRNPNIMARFRSQVRLFCLKNHEYAVEVRQLRKAFEADAELQAAAKELERETWGKTWNEMTDDEKQHVDPRELSKENLWPLPPWECVWYFDEYGFWGPPIKIPNLWFYLSTPIERAYMDLEGELDAWKHEAMKSSNEEKIISCYALLTAIQDQEIPEKPIYTKKVYNGGWPLSGKWINSDNWIHKLSVKCRYQYYPWEQDSYEGSKDSEGSMDTRYWIARAYNDVKADLAGTRQTETGDETMTNIQILQEQFKAAANKYPGLEHTLEDQLTEDCDPEVSSTAADRKYFKIFGGWNKKEKEEKISPASWSMWNIRGANEKGYPKEHYLHRSPHQKWDVHEAVDLFLLRAEEAGKLLIPLPELEGLWVADPAEYWLLALHRVCPGLKLKATCELTEDELEIAAGGSYLSSFHPQKGDEYFEVLDDVFAKSALLCGKLLERIQDTTDSGKMKYDEVKSFEQLAEAIQELIESRCYVKNVPQEIQLTEGIPIFSMNEARLAFVRLKKKYNRDDLPSKLPKDAIDLLGLCNEAAKKQNTVEDGKQKPGGKKERKKDSDRYKLIGALIKLHRLNTEKVRLEPLVSKEIENELGWNQLKVHREMEKIFGNKPMRQYKKCFRGGKELTGFMKKVEDGSFDVDGIVDSTQE